MIERGKTNFFAAVVTPGHGYEANVIRNGEWDQAVTATFGDGDMENTRLVTVAIAIPTYTAGDFVQVVLVDTSDGATQILAHDIIGRGSALPRDPDPLPASRTWSLVSADGGLAGKDIKELAVDDSKRFAVEFAHDCGPHGRIVSVAVEIDSGEEDGVTITTPGRDYTRATFNIEANEPGSYALRVVVMYDTEEQATAVVALDVA